MADQKPSVLFINRVYPPVEGATGEKLSELAAELVAAGWHITVLTSTANTSLPRSKIQDGVHVERVQGLRFTRSRTWKRALGYLSLYPLLLVRALRLGGPFDAIVSKTDPPLHLLLVPLLKRLKRARGIHWAQDLYPEIAEELGVLPQHGFLGKVLKRLSTWALKHHDYVIAIGRCMQQRLLARGVAAEKIMIMPNWAAQEVHPVPDETNTFRQEHELDGRFVVMYSGNMGLAHPFEVILDAASLLKSSEPRILFLFVGDGPRLNWLKEQVTQQGLTNVRFLPFQPKERLAESLSAGDVHIASMHTSLAGLVVPSKVYGALAAARPCIFLGPATSEAALVICEHHCGDVLEQPTAHDLAARIMVWYQDDQGRALAGTRAREAVASYLPGAVHTFARLVAASPTEASPRSASL